MLVTKQFCLDLRKLETSFRSPSMKFLIRRMERKTVCSTNDTDNKYLVDEKDQHGFSVEN